MRLYTLFSFCCLFATFAFALPYASPVDESEFDLGTYFEDLLEERGLQEYFDDVYEDMYENEGLHKRDEKTIEQVLLLVNKSGIIWEALDAVAGHPKRIQFLANQTAKLLSSNTIDLSKITKLSSGMNTTALLEVIKESGLLTSVLDGILLDDDYRPVLTDLIERIVRPNIGIISFLIHDVFQKRSLEKRADYSGTLETFLKNILSTVLSSKIFLNTVSDVVNALNDTGVAVYVVKRFIADESYQNMTADLIKDVYATGAIKISGSLNITALVGTAVSNPKAITNLLGKVLSGDLNLGSSLGKYTGAIKKIIKDLENNGLFDELNNEIFPSSSATSSSTKAASSTKKKELVVTQTSSSSKKAATISMYGNNKENSPSSSSNSGAFSLQQNSNTPVVKCLIYLQTLIFGGAILLI